MTTRSFDNYKILTDAECETRIRTARARLGKQAVLLCHHYQRDDIHRHADLTGDSLMLSRMASETDAPYIVFCGVHFMAEVADLMSRPEQTAILPDLSAGCPMADMANLAKVERCWRELGDVLEVESDITPITYINSAADLKAFCGTHGGIVCTSSNAGSVVRHAFAQRPKALFFPDQHLGRWTGHQMGLKSDEIVVWNPDLPLGGLVPETIRNAKILLWKGHCPVHQMFQKPQIDAFRAQHPEGFVIAHPECDFEVCTASDYVGSTEYIVRTIREAPSGTRWLVGTEHSLVERLARDVAPQGKTVQFMSPLVSKCSTMQRVTPQRLAWTLENLADGHLVNPVRVPERAAGLARLALERMLAIS